MVDRLLPASLSALSRDERLSFGFLGESFGSGGLGEGCGDEMSCTGR